MWPKLCWKGLHPVWKSIKLHICQEPWKSSWEDKNLVTSWESPRDRNAAAVSPFTFFCRVQPVPHFSHYDLIHRLLYIQTDKKSDQAILSAWLDVRSVSRYSSVAIGFLTEKRTDYRRQISQYSSYREKINNSALKLNVSAVSFGSFFIFRRGYNLFKMFIWAKIKNTENSLIGWIPSFPIIPRPVDCNLEWSVVLEGSLWCVCINYKYKN